MHQRPRVGPEGPETTQVSLALTVVCAVVMMAMFIFLTGNVLKKKRYV